MKGKFRGGIVYLIIVGILFMGVFFGANQSMQNHPNELNLGELIFCIENGLVQEMRIEEAGTTAYVTVLLEDDPMQTTLIVNSTVFNEYLYSLPAELLVSMNINPTEQQPSML